MDENGSEQLCNSMKFHSLVALYIFDVVCQPFWSKLHNIAQQVNILYDELYSVNRKMNCVRLSAIKYIVKLLVHTFQKATAEPVEARAVIRLNRLCLRQAQAPASFQKTHL